MNPTARSKEDGSDVEPEKIADWPSLNGILRESILHAVDAVMNSQMLRGIHRHHLDVDSIDEKCWCVDAYSIDLGLEFVSSLYGIGQYGADPVIARHCYFGFCSSKLVVNLIPDHHHASSMRASSPASLHSREYLVKRFTPLTRPAHRLSAGVRNVYPLWDAMTPMAWSTAFRESRPKTAG